MKKIKVCRLATVSYYLVTQLQCQVEYLQDNGIQVMLVSSDGPELSKLKNSKKITHTVIEIPRAISLYNDVRALGKLIIFFWKHQFDIVHSTTPKAGFLAALAAFVTRVPVRLHTFTGQQWVTLKGTTRLISRMADRLIGILNTKCYADSLSQKNFLVEQNILADKKSEVLGQGSLAGVDLRRFNSDKYSAQYKDQLKAHLSISQSSKVIIFVGRITKEKGIRELIGAFLKLVRKGFDTDLLLIGLFDHECGRKIDIDIEDAKLSPRIHLLGFQEKPEKYLAIADLFCLPSYREGFGTVVIEAAAMGVPCIGSSINGLKDAVVDGETGLLVQASDEDALFVALAKVLQEPEMLQRFSENAKLRVQHCFGSDYVNGLLLNEYLELLK